MVRRFGIFSGPVVRISSCGNLDPFPDEAAIREHGETGRDRR